MPKFLLEQVIKWRRWSFAWQDPTPVRRARQPPLLHAQAERGGLARHPLRCEAALFISEPLFF